MTHTDNYYSIATKISDNGDGFETDDALEACESQGLISLLAHPLVKYCNFGVSPVNHSDSEADFSDDKLRRGLNEMDGGSNHDDTIVISRDSEDENAGVFVESCILRTRHRHLY